ncbi:MAG: hypothetical protein HY737_08030 [Candidatus Omnitrophica bacterium]|nr:hypothetical protein [Candidatus Omnitrophota bacterium]
MDSVVSLDCAIQEKTATPDGKEVAGGPIVPSMNFGNLSRRTESICPGNDCDGDGVQNEPLALAGDKFFKVFCGANTSRRSYTLAHQTSAAGLTNGTNNLNGAWVVVPVQATTGDGLTSVGGVMGNCDRALGNKTLYTSAAAGTAGVVELVYAIGDRSPHVGSTLAHCSSVPAGFAPIPPDQQAGAYAGTVTWTLTVNP